ncbi:MAG: Type 4 prepilin-like proteins leader peptide-processing enzyme [Gammaproteobacteria bacterium]|nr:Type 4 prepilin-like proteins leader peptide-processing enzyme [Gammaproteobacteria bacterium]
MMDSLSATPVLTYIAAIAIGLVVGSFLNVVIHRLPIMMEREWRAHCAELAGNASESTREPEPYNLCRPRSCCPKCKHPIRAHENIPLLSWVLQKGRCRGCGERISLRYPTVEILGAVLGVLALWRFGPTLPALGAAGLGWALLAAAAIDLDHQLLPDSITLPALWAGLALNVHDVYAPLHAAVLGAIAGYLLLWLVYWAFKLTTGKEGMGYGDFKLLAALGAWAGWQQLPVIVLLASATGAIVGISFVLFRWRGRSQPIPFGPFLACAGWIAVLWGPAISGGYLRLTGME